MKAPWSAILLGGMIAVFVLLDIFLPKEGMIRQVAGIGVLIGYILTLVIWNVAAKMAALSKRVAKLVIFMDDGKVLDEQVFISDIIHAETHGTGNVTILVLERPLEFQGDKYSKFAVITEKAFESVHNATEARIDYQDWEILHPYVYYIMGTKEGTLEEEGEKVLLVKSLLDSISTEKVAEAIESRYRAEVMKLKLEIAQLQEDLEILLHEPIKAREYTSRVLRYFVIALVGARNALNKLGEKPMWKDPTFYIVVGGVLLLAIIALDQAGIIHVPKPFTW